MADTTLSPEELQTLLGSEPEKEKEAPAQAALKFKIGGQEFSGSPEEIQRRFDEITSNQERESQAQRLREQAAENQKRAQEVEKETGYNPEVVREKFTKLLDGKDLVEAFDYISQFTNKGQATKQKELEAKLMTFQVEKAAEQFMSRHSVENGGEYEGNAENMKIIDGIMKHRGYDITSVEGFEDAWRFARDKKFIQPKAAEATAKEEPKFKAPPRAGRSNSAQSESGDDFEAFSNLSVEEMKKRIRRAESAGAKFEF